MAANGVKTGTNRYAAKFPSPLMYTDQPAGTTSYVTKGENVGRYETRGQTTDRYQPYTPAELNYPVSAQTTPAPDGWIPEWPVTVPIGPSANYRVLPGYNGCGVCGGLGADPLTTAQNMAAVVTPGAATPATTSTAGWVVPAVIAGVALLIFWGTLKQGR